SSGVHKPSPELRLRPSQREGDNEATLLCYS
ncbi:MAG: hypothetical protein ACI9G1_003850, partial [Pirellulaceae bacterium]